MTFDPVLPVWLLAGLAAIAVIVRLATLHRLLVHAAAGRYRAVVLRWTGLTVALLLLLFAAFRPGLTGGEDRDGDDPIRAVSNINVFLVVDRSATTGVTDYGDGKSRMTGIRNDIRALIDEYAGGRFDLIGFADQAHVEWPLSQDGWSLKAFAAGLKPYPSSPDNAVDAVDPTAAREVLRQRLQVAKERYPKARNLIFYFGDGVVGAQAQPQPFTIPQDLYSGGAVLGYGTAADAATPAGQAAEADVTAPLNEAQLREIAEQLDLPYHHRQPGREITEVLPPVRAGVMVETDPADDEQLVGRLEWYWLLASGAAVLLLVEFVLTVRQYRRNQLLRGDVVKESR